MDSKTVICIGCGRKSTTLYRTAVCGSVARHRQLIHKSCTAKVDVCGHSGCKHLILYTFDGDGSKDENKLITIFKRVRSRVQNDEARLAKAKEDQKDIRTWPIDSLIRAIALKLR